VGYGDEMDRVVSKAMTKKGLRPGGRSARVQTAVHKAVLELQKENGRDGLTVPAIAVRAGVTPSTIYRRWGDLSQLLSDVARENFNPDSPPLETGSFRGDMEAWLEQYLEEISSEVGAAMLRDMVSNPDPLNSGVCARSLGEQFGVMRARAKERGEWSPETDTLINHVFAPLVYRLLFASEVPDVNFARDLLDKVLQEKSP